MMRVMSFTKTSLLLLLLLLLLFSFSPAQHFVVMTDEQWVELALDMIRKGVQQQDTTKILTVMAQEVSVNGKASQSRSDIAGTIQGIFDQAHQRKVDLQRPSFPRSDNPLHLSNFWDFDILDPKITIEGDSAVVECELVLWGSSTDQGTGQRGKRTEERFLFRAASVETVTRQWPQQGSPKRSTRAL
jgi:hypothetical protein